MVERVAVIVLLVEDSRQETLIRRYLHRLGHTNRTMRVVKSSPGRGSGEQFVRQSYASEVRSIRSQLTRTNACLAAMIDADMRSVHDRRQELDRALKDADELPRSPTEPILNLVPKRHVETWVLCLNSLAVDETRDYRHDARIDPQAIKEAANALHGWTRPNAAVPPNVVASLLAGLPEFQRIPGA